MYTAILLILLAIAIFALITGINRKSVGLGATGLLIGVLTGLFFWFMNFWGEKLWFDAIGYTQRFWTVFNAKIGFLVLGAFTSCIIVYLLTFFIPARRKVIRYVAILLSLVIGATWGYNSWDIILKMVNGVQTGVTDPILSKDTGFYLFTYPFLKNLFELFLLIALVSLGASIISLLFRLRDGNIQTIDLRSVSSDERKKSFRSLYISAIFLVLVLAFDQYLNRFDLMFSQMGAVTGPGWTDAHIRLPAYSVLIGLTLLIGLIIALPPIRNRVRTFFFKPNTPKEASQLYLLAGFGGLIFGIWIIALSIVPSVFQWLAVEPNEITYEKPYIANNIEFTRKGFGLDKVEEKQFQANEEFTNATIDNKKALFDNIRLWDWRALDAVYKQFQEIRLYYEFNDVDIDRYTIDSNYRQVMVSARELQLSNLPEKSQTFVNKRFKYTHGNGITLSTVSDFQENGLPNMLIKDIPPRSQYPSLQVDTPQIYYGSVTNNHVISNSTQKEFDYPSGDENVYTSYNGKGGVQLSNTWRKFIYGYKFDGTRLFVSNYPTGESRMMFHRTIEKRLKTLAPFLKFDQDPYIVLSNGKLYWIADAYTASPNYPYSEPFQSRETIEYEQQQRTRSLQTDISGGLDGVNYVRNSVKVVVDAYNGSVDFYTFDEEDPLIQTWSNIFPDMFKPRKAMPDDLEKHVRYPTDMLLVQSLLYSKYHMTDPTVFYNQEDLWIRATEKYYNNVQPVDPYYVMWDHPETDGLEFSLIQPFTPKNRQVLIGWVAALCDPDNYGRIMAYKFPKEKRMLGPQQVESKIDQNSYLSEQLSLWDQRGSNVIRGNVLAIPVQGTVLYVEPIYLESETAAYPELRLVVVMHGDDLIYAKSFDEALRGLVSDRQPEATSEQKEGDKAQAEDKKDTPKSMEKLIQRANKAFQDYLENTGNKQFDRASRALDRLEKTLRELSNQDDVTIDKVDTTVSAEE